MIENEKEKKKLRDRKDFILACWLVGGVEKWSDEIFFLFAWDEKLEDKKCRMYKFTHVTSKEYIYISY